jgi:GNAT superfamily N-acetyltransferase
MTDYFFETADSADLQYLRDLQVKELRGTAQDGTEEGIVTYHADFIKIRTSKDTAGYACIGTHDLYKGRILEFYLLSRYRIDAADIILQMINTYECRQWLVSTHDFFAFPVLLDLQLPYQIDAYTFAMDDTVKIAYSLGAEITIEATTPHEIEEAYPLLLQDGFYTGGDISSVFPLVSDKEMYSMRKNSRLIGAGFIGPSKRTPMYADIAMIIHRDERRLGYGVLLVSALVSKCRRLGLLPTAVCAASNTASKKALQKAGFYLDGCLLLAQVDNLSTTG